MISTTCITLSSLIKRAYNHKQPRLKVEKLFTRQNHSCFAVNMVKRMEINSQRQYNKTLLSNTKRRGDHITRKAVHSSNDTDLNWSQQATHIKTPECNCRCLNETLRHYTTVSFRNFSKKRKCLIEACVAEKIHSPLLTGFEKQQRIKIHWIVPSGSLLSIFVPTFTRLRQNGKSHIY